MIALKINTKFEVKLTGAFKNDMRNLANIHRLNNNNFILEKKYSGTKSKSKFKTSRLTRCSVKTLFYLGNK